MARHKSGAMDSDIIRVSVNHVECYHFPVPFIWGHAIDHWQRDKRSENRGVSSERSLLQTTGEQLTAKRSQFPMPPLTQSTASREDRSTGMIGQRSLVCEVERSRALCGPVDSKIFLALFIKGLAAIWKSAH